MELLQSFIKFNGLSFLSKLAIYCNIKFLFKEGTEKNLYQPHVFHLVPV